MSFLVDTDICSAHLKCKGIVTNRFLQYGGQLNISTITAGELYTWALRANASSQRLTALTDLLRDVQVLDVTTDVARKFGELRAMLLDAGQPTPDLDLLIAATALVHGLILVTHNIQDFVRIPDLHLLDWLTS